MEHNDDLDAVTTTTPTASRNPLLVFWRRRWLILLGAVVGIVLGLLVYSQKDPIYQTQAQVLIVKGQSAPMKISGGDPSMGFYEDYVSTHVALIRTPVVVERAVQKRHLGTLPSFQGNPNPVGAILAGLQAGREESTDGNPAPKNIMNLSYVCGDAQDSQKVLDSVIESYRDFLDATYRAESDNTVALVTNARDLLKEDLESKEKQYREFRKTSPLLWKDSGGANIHLSRIKEFQTRQTALLTRRTDLQERLKAIEKARKEGGSRAFLLALATRPLDKTVETTAQLERGLEKELFPLLLKEKELLHHYGEDHPDVIRVRKQIVMTKEFFERLEKVEEKAAGRTKSLSSDRLEGTIQALKQELLLVETSLEGLDKLQQTEETKARALEHYEIQDEEFRTGIARINRVLEQTLKSLKEVSLVRDFGGFKARVIAPPTVGTKVAPKLTQTLAAGFILGLAAGMGLAYLLEILDKSFRSPDEIKRRLGLPVVGHIPFASEESRMAVSKRGPLDPSLAAYHRPKSLDAEAFRSVRTAVFFSTQAERLKVLQVTSPNMGDGKTTLIANLAISIAQSGRRVVLIDADFRRPRIHRLFDVPARTGMAMVVSGECSMDEAVQPSGVPGLSIVPCGPRPANPSELLTLPRFEEALEELREEYDFVLVDTPPLLAVTDPCVVAPRVEGVLLVVRASRNGRPPAERACGLLTGLGVNVLGVVVNGVGKQGAMHGYGYEHYHYGYEYTSEYTESSADAEEQTTVSAPQPSTNGEKH